jgi:hypothetical protein
VVGTIDEVIAVVLRGAVVIDVVMAVEEMFEVSVADEVVEVVREVVAGKDRVVDKPVISSQPNKPKTTMTSVMIISSGNSLFFIDVLNLL